MIDKMIQIDKMKELYNFVMKGGSLTRPDEFDQIKKSTEELYALEKEYSKEYDEAMKGLNKLISSKQEEIRKLEEEVEILQAQALHSWRQLPMVVQLTRERRLYNEYLRSKDN